MKGTQKYFNLLKKVLKIYTFLRNLKYSFFFRSQNQTASIKNVVEKTNDFLHWLANAWDEFLAFLSLVGAILVDRIYGKKLVKKYQIDLKQVPRYKKVHLLKKINFF